MLILHFYNGLRRLANPCKGKLIPIYGAKRHNSQTLSKRREQIWNVPTIQISILSEVCLLYDSNKPQNILKMVRLEPLFRRFRRKMPLLYWNLNKYNEMGLQFNFKNTLTICSSQLAKKLMCDLIYGYFNMNDRMISKFHILS